MKNTSANKQSGAVSLFVVIFFMLLVTVITVSFVRLMVADQKQATQNDLSQSAYDSAQAGVEDAKRALLKYQKDCADTPASCSTQAAKLASIECNAGLNDFLGLSIGDAPNSKTPEVKVQKTQSGGTDAALDQAYTCVTLKLETDDYVGTLTANQSQMIPLVSDRPFDRVKLEWFTREDIPASSPAVSLTGVSGTGQPLYSQGTWPVNRPSLMRAQLMQVPKATTFNLNNFDTISGAQSNAATMFLYPTSQGGIVSRDFMAYDQRRTSTATDPLPKDRLNTPLPVTCVNSLSSGGFACSVELVLPQAIGSTSTADRTAFLRIQALYNASHFRATLWNGSTPALFKDVQPEIDSTGRANDLFKRVVSRVDLYDTTFPYPDAAVDVTGNFCKDFSVTDSAYIPGPSGCAP